MNFRTNNALEVLLLASAAAVTTTVSAYDIGCIYPPNMPNPFDARYAMHEYSGSFFMQEAIETPIVIHVAALSSLCQANCLAYHDDSVLNAITEERPIVTVPSEYHNSWSRMLCIAQCFALLGDEVGRYDFYKDFFDKWELTGMERRRDIIGLGVITSYDGDSSGLQSLLEQEDHHPFTVGQIVATEILLHVIEDGWNALGQWNYDPETGGSVKCTANCERYKDTTGYFPRNNPVPGKIVNGTDKYVVEGMDKYWQPLDDNDESGAFRAATHVTPHIGFLAKPRLHDSVDDFPDCPDPEYDFRAEALTVVERLKNTSSDALMKQKVAFFDNKLLVINLVETVVKNTYPDQYSFEDELLYIEGMSAGEYEATLMAWRAKVKHDIVRPTTVIQRWGSDILNTFTGDKMKDGPGDIAARDFQAFQRVMPHSEYPSGSSCICTAYAEMTDAFTKNYYNGTIKDITWGAAGSGAGFGCDPDKDPALLVSLGCEDDFTIPDMPTLLDQCSQSRLWAGFHFTAAVTEGEKMCKGVGLMSAEREKRIRNGSDFGQKYMQGDARPTCSNPEMMTTVSAESQSSAMTSWNLLAATVSVLAATTAMMVM